MVILSRTRLGKDTIFIGNAEQVAECLFNSLLQGDQFSEYIDHILEWLLRPSTTPEPTIDTTICSYPFRGKDVVLPNKHEPCVYFILLLTDNDVTYIGFTKSAQTT